MSANDLGKHEHGVKVDIDFSNPKTKELYGEICKLAETAVGDLGLMLFSARMLGFIHCKQCMKDIILQFRDVAGLIEELVNDPIKHEDKV